MRRVWVCVWVLLVLLGVGGCQFLRPSAPAGLSASAGTYVDRVRLTWSAVGSATRYEVWRSEIQSGPFSLLGETQDTLYDDTAVTPGKVYWYKVRACNRFGCSELSEAVSGRAAVVPAVPTGVAASRGEFSDRVRVTWDPVFGADWYEIHRASAYSSQYGTAGTVPTPPFDDMNVEDEMIYWYKVRACSAAGCSDFSTPVSGYTSGIYPAAPTNFRASDGEVLVVLLSWDPSPKATFYVIHRAIAEAGPYGELDVSDEPEYEDFEVEPGQTYWYKVRACNNYGCSAYSNVDSGYAVEP